MSVLFKALDPSQGFLFIGFVYLELPITPVLEIFPQSKIYEGDQLDILCTVRNVLQHSEGNLYLSQGNQLLRSGDTKVNHSKVALAKDPGEFECRFEMGDVVKYVSKTVSVTGEWTEENDLCVHTVHINLCSN